MSIRCTKCESAGPSQPGRQEVTQAQYRFITRNNPSEYSARGGGKNTGNGLSTDRLPVENVSWYDASLLQRVEHGRGDQSVST